MPALTAAAYPAQAAVPASTVPARQAALRLPAPRHLTPAQRRAWHARHVRHLSHLRHLAYLRWLRTRPPVAHPVYHAPAHPLGGSGGAVVASSGRTPSGQLGCTALEQLWEDAGGNPSEAFMAAEIAMAESGGSQYAHSPTDDYGYWQINASNGSLATYDAYGNARSAVIISHDGTDWYPWTTYTSGAYQGKCGGGSPATVAMNGVKLTSVQRVSVSRENIDARALDWAETQAGRPYYYGGTGPYSYDCSGLVYTAFRHVGISLPRTTFEMLNSWHLVPVSVPRRGDLAFFGSGHVEFVTTWYHGTFGAQDWGTLVGWHTWSGWWHPTMFFAVR